MIINKYTPRLVPRPYTDPPAVNYAALSIHVQWDTDRDLLSYTVDGVKHEGHRRGARLFDTWAECNRWSKEQGYPLG